MSRRARIKQIIGVIVRNRSIDPVKVRFMLEELGPTFIKIGQILSTRLDILDEAYITELKILQDNVKPEEPSIIKKIIMDNIKGDVENVFEVIEETPIASGSIAQVHAARLKTGEKVVVKVKRLHIKEIIENDLKLLKDVALITRLAMKNTVLNPVDLIGEIEKALKIELDFYSEQNNIKKFYEYNKDDTKLSCIKVYEEYTTNDLIIMDYAEGISVGQKELLEGVCSTTEIGKNLMINYIKQIVEDGFFHADPHPGNILINDNKIIYIDFGLVGVLSNKLKSKLSKMLTAVISGDIQTLTRIIIQLTAPKKEIDRQKIYDDIEDMYNNYADENLENIKLSSLINQVFRTCTENGLKLPKDIVLLAKGLMTIEGIIEELAPKMSIIEVIYPYFRKNILKSIDLKKDLIEQAENIYILAKNGVRIPNKFLELMNKTIDGRLSLELNHSKLEKSIREIGKMINRLVFAIIAASLILASSVIISAGIGPKVFEISVIGLIGYVTAGLLGVWILISMMSSGKV
ncbi:MAG: hypothetical protein A2Y24_06135 [Clostridiales bacterium GWE2_32_10]|nr:MAG: hypothetical protein A2Y24_06135 [Clostridiales bacterium GWE2_32_10]